MYADSFRSNEYQGHASLCAGEPNAYGIPTCKCFNMAPVEANWNDSKDFDFIHIYIKKAIDKIPKNKPIVVLSGIGKQAPADMMLYCPKLYNYMMEELTKFKNVTIL